MMDEWMLDNLLRSVQQLDISDNQTVPTNGSTSVEAAAAANIQQSVNMQTLSGPNESGQPGVIGGENRSANSQLQEEEKRKQAEAAEAAAANAPIQDLDSVINCDLMDGHDAKFSSMSMLYELHNQGQDKFVVYTCNNCKSHVETRYHCTVCDDFDLCVSCKDKDGHPHPMEKLSFDFDDGSSLADAKQTNPQEARKLKIQRCIQLLVYVCQCKDANCRLPSCQKMKRVVMHMKNCKRKTNGGCPICIPLISLCCCHAKHCQETKCLVLFCSNIKHKIKQPQLQQQLQQAQLLSRRMAVMNTRPTGPVAAMQAGQQTSNVAMTTGVAMKSGVSTSNLPTQHQPGIGLNLDRRRFPLMWYRWKQRGNKHRMLVTVRPGGGVGVGGQTSRVMPPPQMQRPLPVQMPNTSGTHLIPMDQWTASRYQSNAVMQQNPTLARQQIPQQLMQQQQHQAQPLTMSAQMPRQPGVIGPVGQVGPQAANMQKHAQQLLQILRSPHTLDQQNQILQILKNNPPLMAAFIKHHQQPGQHGGGVGGPLGPNQPHASHPDGSVDSKVGPQAANMQKHVLQQLMQTLRSPHTPDQQNQILQILKSNPPLMAAFIKQRALVHQQQPGQHGGGVSGPLGPNQPHASHPHGSVDSKVKLN